MGICSEDMIPTSFISQERFESGRFSFESNNASYGQGENESTFAKSELDVPNRIEDWFVNRAEIESLKSFNENIDAQNINNDGADVSERDNGIYYDSNQKLDTGKELKCGMMRSEDSSLMDNEDIGFTNEGYVSTEFSENGGETVVVNGHHSNTTETNENQ